MKKTLAIILLILLIASLVACGGNKQSTASNESPASRQNDPAQTNQNEDQNSNDNNSAKSYSTQSITDFMAMLNSTLDMSQYEESDGYNDGTWIKLSRKDNSVKPNMTFTIDGLSITLPVKYSDLINGGWKDKDNLGEETLDKSSITNIVFETTRGKWVTFSFINDSEETKAIKDLSAVKVTLSGSANEAEFSIQGGITNTYDLKQIVQTSAPSYIDITDDNDSKTLVTSSVIYRADDDKITINYYHKDNTIHDVTIEKGLAGTIITY